MDSMKQRVKMDVSEIIIFEKEIKEITEDLYNSCGSDTGILFGIPINHKNSITAIIRLVLKRERKINKY